jgi:hypothetical protein
LYKNISSMQAFETIGTIDTKGHIKLSKPLTMRNKVVKIIIMIAEIDDLEEKDTDWWNDLTPQQQLELKNAIAECEDPTKLTSHEEVVKMSRQWLQE